MGGWDPHRETRPFGTAKKGQRSAEDVQESGSCGFDVRRLVVFPGGGGGSRNVQSR